MASDELKGIVEEEDSPVKSGAIISFEPVTVDRYATEFFKKPAKKWKQGVMPKRLPDAPSLRMIRKLSAIDFMDSGLRLMQMTNEQVKKVFENPDTRMADKIVARCIFEASKGSLTHMRELWDRIYGVVPKAIDLRDDPTRPGGSEERPLAKMSTEQLIGFLRKIDSLEPTCPTYQPGSPPSSVVEPPSSSQSSDTEP